MTHWRSQIDTGLPCWDGYRKLLGQLSASLFPDTTALNEILPREISSGGRAAIRFVPASRLPGVQYEQHIFETGEVSTRENNWHDLFNALAWCRFPRLKLAMNSLHYKNLGREKGGRRGQVRDALTLLDESGVIVVGSNRSALDALASRDWKTAFFTHKAAWRTQLHVLICGHAILEKFLKPYKAITAHALFLHAPDPISEKQLDILLASSLSEGRLLDSTADLSPLPLMGIPGWWPAGEQDRAFYDDRCVFRPIPGQINPVPIHKVSDL
jgi:hypothetical protein